MVKSDLGTFASRITGRSGAKIYRTSLGSGSSGLGLVGPNHARSTSCSMAGVVTHPWCEWLRAFVPRSSSKRSLCYAVGGGWAPSDDFGRFMVSAGTTPDRAAETVQVVEEVMHGVLNERPSEEEIARAKEGVLSALTLRRESTAARASVLGNHFTTFGEVWDPKRKCSPSLMSIKPESRRRCRRGLGDPLGHCIGGNKPIF